MKSAFYIVRLSQIGNVGAHQIEKLTLKHLGLDENGFETYELAEEKLEQLLNDKNSWIGCAWHSYGIMKLYQQDK